MGTRRIMFWIVAAAALAAGFAVPGPARAQDNTPEARRQELETRRGELGSARAKAEQLSSEIAEISKERARLAEELVTTAAEISSTEELVAASEQRLRDLSASERDVQVKLAESRAVVAELLAALQRMGRHPPPAIIVQPGDALSAVRTAMLLGNLLPEIRAQAQELADDLAELERVRLQIDGERTILAQEQADLEASRSRIAVLIDARQQRQAERESELADERGHVGRLSRDVRSLEELIARMERDVSAARKAADAAAKADKAAPVTPGARGELATLSNPGRLAPALAFHSAKGRLPMPVNGITLSRFGEADAFGSTQKGLSIQTRSKAQVMAPCDGWVVYAGPFRSYGQVLILNAGGGYHVLLAGMQRVNVTLGQFVLTGEPVAEMGEAANQTASMVGGGAEQPVLYVEFRKDGQSINPGPWWASSSAEKVRG
jgi:murein hydrolase activator